MAKRLSIINSFSVLLVIVINYLSQIKLFNHTTIGEISKKYDNLFTPADYAFSIWGIIFLSILGYCFFQIKRAFNDKKSKDFIVSTGYWFAIANILNALWVLAFVFDLTGLSVLIMFVLLYSLIKIVLNTNMENWDAPIEIIAFVWWPICLYSGWIAVASIANVSSYLTKLDWQGFMVTEENWTIIMIAVALCLNLLMIWRRNMREFAAVGIWAFFAIFMRHRMEYPTIANVALTSAIILVVTTLIHGYQNRDTNPFKKWQQRQKG